jgi:hypothetical protein
MSNSLYIILAVLLLSTTSAFATTYYVDAVDGNDSYSGTSEADAWQTMGKIDSMTFGPGDKIKFKKGQVFSGNFELHGDGAAGNPIIINSYGSGAKPSLQATDSAKEVIRLKSNQYVTIKNIEVMNDNNGSDINYGIRIYFASDPGVIAGLEFQNITFLKIRGLKEECYGLYAEIDKDNAGTSYWDGVLIENCTFDTVNGAGCKWKDKSGTNADINRAYWYPTLNFVFRNNYGTNLQKYLCSWSGCQGAVVEYNLGDPVGTIHGNGLWPFNSDDSIIQYNDMRHTRTNGADGHAYDLDFNCNRTIVQYNFGADCKGGALCLTCNGELGSSFHDGAICRYNIFVDCGWISTDSKSDNIFLNGRITNAKIYNNTFYIPSGRTANIINVNNWGGVWPDNIEIRNNIFHVDGTGTYRNFTSATNMTCTNNVFYGNVNTKGTGYITDDPLLVAPGQNEFNATKYKIQTGSPCIDAGVTVTGHSDVDYFGNAVPAGAQPDIGAHEHLGHGELFYPTDDTYSKENDANTNFGDSDVMHVRTNSTKEKNSYLKFNVTGVTGEVQSALLKLRVGENPIDDLTVHTVADTAWDEMTLSWNNAPAIGAGIDTVDNLDANTWYEWDLTPVISGNGLYSFALTSQVDLVYRKISTKDSAYAPVLEIVHDGNPPDINGDGNINFEDYEVIAWHWLLPCTDPNWCEGADLDLSGLVDWQDVKTFTQSWDGLP